MIVRYAIGAPLRLGPPDRDADYNEALAALAAIAVFQIEALPKVGRGARVSGRTSKVPCIAP